MTLKMNDKFDSGIVDIHQLGNKNEEIEEGTKINNEEESADSKASTKYVIDFGYENPI